MTLRYLPLLAILVALGCGKSIERGTISGTVTIGGQLAKGGTITFQLMPETSDVKMEDLPEPVTVEIQPDGTYIAEGVPYGNLAIGVSPPPPPEVPATAGQPGAVSASTISAAKAEMGRREREGVNVRDGEADPKLYQAAGGAGANTNIDAAKANAQAKYADPLQSGFLFKLEKPQDTYNAVVP